MPRGIYEGNKGRIPWNKGTKGIMKPNITSFKKGNIPYFKNNPVSIETREKIRQASKKRIGILSPRWKGGPKEKECIFCHNKYKNYIKKSKFCSKKCFDNFQRKFPKIKELSPRWIKNRNNLKKSENKMNDVQYRYWTKEVKKRDNWKCRLLNKECSGRLEAHHILNWIDYPELRYVVNNGITLCAFHHPRKWEEEKRMIPIFQELLSVSKE